MMQRLAAYMVAVLMVLHVGRQGICIVVFKLNQQQIAAELCVKRFQKDNCCLGRCQLEKVQQQAGNELPGQQQVPQVPSAEAVLNAVASLQPFASFLMGEYCPPSAGAVLSGHGQRLLMPPDAA